MHVIYPFLYRVYEFIPSGAVDGEHSLNFGEPLDNRLKLRQTVDGNCSRDKRIEAVALLP